MDMNVHASAGAKSGDVDMKARNVLLGEVPVEEEGEEEEEIFFRGDETSAPSTRRPAAQPRKPCHIEENENKTQGDDEEEDEQSEGPYLGPLGNTKYVFYLFCHFKLKRTTLVVPLHKTAT